MNPNNWSGAMAGGAGRGMPNMNMNMNMNMGMGMGMGMNMNMNPNMPQQKGPNFHNIIYQNLQASQQQDGPFSGWRSQVPILERASQVKILFDSLRMLGEGVDIRRSLDIAVAFERRQFLQSTSLETYKQSLHEKLSSIRDQRQQQAVAAVSNMPNNMQMMNPAFQQAQQQAPMNQMTPNMNFQQPSGMQPSPSFNPMIQQRAMNQPNQGMNPAQMNQANRPNPPELTKEDNTWINTRAAEMAKSTARDEMARIVESMEPRVRQSLKDKNIDPIIYHFRMKATKEFRVMQAQKNAQNQLNNMARMTTPQQNPGVPVAQQNGNAFMDIEAFRSQQDEGMRSQQEGQLVVPASQPSVNDIRQRFAQQIRAQNPNASQPELQQMLMNRLRQWQQQMQARNQMNPAQRAMIQNAGQGQNLTGGMPQPRPVSVLNQPMNQQGPVGSPAQNLARPQSRPQSGQPGQPMGQAQPMQGQFTPEQIMGHWEKLPLPLKNMLNAHPQNMWPKIVMDFRQRTQQAQQQASVQRQMMQQAQPQQQQPQQQQPQQQQQPLPQQGMNMQRTVSQQPPNIPSNQRIQQIQNNQFPGAVAMQQSLSRGAEPNNAAPNMTSVQRPQQPAQQQQPNNAQNALRMQQQQQQQQIAAMQQGMNQTPQNQATEDALIRESDDNPLPANMRQQLGQVFPGQNTAGLATWRQLRELAISVNDQRIPPAKIRAMQLQYVRRLQQQRAAMAAQGGQPIQQQPQPNLQNMAQQNPQNQRQLTQNDIIMARRQNPNWAPLSDDQIRQLLQQQVKPGNQKQQPNASGQAPNLPTSQVQNNNKAVTQQNTTQQAPQQNRQPVQNQNQTQAPKPAATAETKNLKRPNQDDVPEQNNAQQTRKFPGQVQITKEQFEKMTPAEQEKVKHEHKKYESLRKIAQLSSEVNAMKKLPPITNMDPQSRQRITAMLTSDNLKSILTRFDSFLMAFAQTDNDLQMLQTLIQHRWRLVQQFKPESVMNKTYVPADMFTLHAENLEAIITQISNKFHQALQKSQRPNNNAGNNAQQQSIPLTQENLNMAAQQAAQQQKRPASTKPKDAPPPAPTADKPPFQFPGDRGQGTPKYAAPGFKPEDLKLPPKKKPRNDQSASPATPVQATIPKPVFKCNFPGCSMQTQGFASQAELDMHRNTIHKPDMEPVKDPLSFLDSSLQQAFNLDENLQSKRPASAAPPMQKSLSRPGSGTQKGNKMGTPSAMARSASQQGGKASPASTVQQKNIQSNKAAVPNPALLPPIDEWQDATFSFDNLNDIYGPNESGDVIPMGNDSMSNIQAVANTYMKNNEDWKWNEREGPDSSDSSAKSKSPDQGSEPSLPNGEKAAPPNPYHVDLKVDGNALPVLEGNFEDLFMDDGTGGDKDWTMLDTDGSLSPWEKIEGMDGGNQMQVQPGAEFELDSWITMPTLDDNDFPTGEEAMKILEGMPMTY